MQSTEQHSHRVSIYLDAESYAVLSKQSRNWNFSKHIREFLMQLPEPEDYANSQK